MPIFFIFLNTPTIYFTLPIKQQQQNKTKTKKTVKERKKTQEIKLVPK